MVSVGMPAFNSALYVRDALNSLLRQDYVDLELIVSDDGSADATAEIVAEVSRHDPR